MFSQCGPPIQLGFETGQLADWEGLDWSALDMKVKVKAK